MYRSHILCASRGLQLLDSILVPACEVALWQQLGTDELNAPLDRCSQVRAGLQRG